MIELLGQTQQELLRLLNKHKDGLTMSELSEMLGVARNAVKQHLTALEKNNLLEHGILHKTAGRPTQSYILTEKGKEHFPRKYSWLAQILLENIKAEKDEKGFQHFLQKLGASISSQYLPQLAKLKPEERIKKAATILTELGYDAEVIAPNKRNENLKLEVSNCVFYQLTSSCPEICGFDVSLISMLTGEKVKQQSCISSGGNVCSFGIKK